MGQTHFEQWGKFHITTNAKNRAQWCTSRGVPEILIRDLKIAGAAYEAEIISYCILPDHIHFICIPGPKGLSRFVQSFKCNASRNIHNFLVSRSKEHVLLATGTRAAENMYPFNIPTRSRGSVTPALFTGWQHGFHDERIRDDRQLDAAKNYVEYNAFLHGLVTDPLDWPWTSLPKYMND